VAALGALRNSSPAERSDVGEVPSERSSRGGGDVRSTGCSPRAAHATRPSRSPPSPRCARRTPELLLDRAPRGRGGAERTKFARRRGRPINGLLASRSARNPSELVPSVASLREAHSGTPPRPSTARSGRCLANEVREAEGTSDQRVARLAQRTQPVQAGPLRRLAPRGDTSPRRSRGEESPRNPLHLSREEPRDERERSRRGRSPRRG